MSFIVVQFGTQLKDIFVRTVTALFKDENELLQAGMISVIQHINCGAHSIKA